MMIFTKATPISLKQHPEFNEKWLQERIIEDPSLLGLGELMVKDVERSQPHAGRSSGSKSSSTKRDKVPCSREDSETKLTNAGLLSANSHGVNFYDANFTATILEGTSGP